MGKAALNVAHVSLSPCCKCRTVSADQMHTTSGQLSNKSRTSAKGMLHKWRSLDLEASLLEGNGFCKLAPVYAQSIILCWNAEYQNLGLGKWSCRPTLLPAYLLSHSRRMDLAPLRCCYLLPYLLRPQEVTSEYSEPRAHPCQGIARQEACLEEFSGSRSRHHTLPIGKKIWREMRTLAQLNASNSRSSSDSSNTTESVAIVRKLTQKTFLLVAFRRP